jgi:molybdate transport system ATP-binding protein
MGVTRGRTPRGGVMLEVSLQHRLGEFALDARFAVSGVTALVGPSGAGKTSVINAVAGLLRPDAGRIVFDGQVLCDKGIWVPAHQRGFGVVFQEGRLFPHLNVRQNLTYGGAHDLDAVVDMLGVRALLDRRPAGLSGGERQRVALGRALLMRPRMLLLDEPLSGLDAARKAEILPYLERIRDMAKVPILYVSHAGDEVARLANHVVQMEGGRVL